MAPLHVATLAVQRELPKRRDYIKIKAWLYHVVTPTVQRELPKRQD